jgi:predicted Kef-type K+ transport protein/Trk K+ transport system NAD-binding subunit
MFENTFIEIAAILSLAVIVGILGRKLRQPLIIMFLATGILAGPAALGIIKSYDQIELLANIGIAILLFIVGLKLDIHLIRTTGPVALATGMGQIIFTSLIGFLIAVSLKIPLLEAAYVAVALTFSSTIIIVKLLSDKKEIDSLHGQIAIGFLIVQDIAAVLALVVLTTFGAQAAQTDSMGQAMLIVTAKGILFLGAIGLLMKYVLPGLTRRLAHSTELLTLFAIAWAVSLGAGGELLGFSKEVGAFLAGISLASTEFRDLLGARLTSLRDFLLLFFFITLGARLEWGTVGAQMGSSMLFSVFVLVGNPLIVSAIMGFMGYRRRTGFLAGLTVAQISEFSLIVAALGLSIGHITNDTMGLITLVGILTISISTYMILYSDRLYKRLAPVLTIFERENPYREAAIDTLETSTSADIILAGLGNYGGGLAEYLLRRNKTVLGVDFDPSNLDKWRGRGMTVLYGDMTDPDMYEHLPLNESRWFISTVRSRPVNIAMINHLNHLKYEGKVALTASSGAEADEYRSAGAHIVFRPLRDATEQAADSLTNAMDFLPDKVNWPISFLEVRIRSDADSAGKTIQEIPLRSATGTSVLAVSRGGRIHYDPKPDFQVFPGDRLLIMGPPDGLKSAEEMLNRYKQTEDVTDSGCFEIGEIKIASDSDLVGKSVSDLRFRQKYGVTLVGIRRNDEKITAINPEEKLYADDCLIVIGACENIHELNNRKTL